jgi:hypothetical protein
VRGRRVLRGRGLLGGRAGRRERGRADPRTVRGPGRSSVWSCGLSRMGRGRFVGAWASRSADRLPREGRIRTGQNDRIRPARSREFGLQMSTFLVEEVVDAAAVGGAGRIVVGRGVAGRRAGVAGGSGGAGSAALRSGLVGADRGELAAAGPGSWSPDDLDADLCAVDGHKAPHRLGLRDADAGGLGLAASAEVLPDRAGGAGAGRVHGAQAHAQARSRDRQRHHQGRDRQGQAGEAVSPAGGRIDSTVVEADAPYPTDSGLALDSARVLAREARRLGAKVGRDAGHVRDRSRAIGRRVRA